MGHDEPISENTSVKLGLLIALGTALISLLCGGIWWIASWSASVQVKLDNISILLNQATSNDKTQANELAEMEKRINTIELVGSQPLKTLETELKELRKEFERHSATTMRLNQ